MTHQLDASIFQRAGQFGNALESRRPWRPSACRLRRQSHCGIIAQGEDRSFKDMSPARNAEPFLGAVSRFKEQSADGDERPSIHLPDR
jgi:hypothetical protein